MIAFGRHLITESPKGQEICEYLRNDTLAIGWLLIPAKYKQKEMTETQRAKRYEYLLRRGLPIPPELMPKNAEEEMERKRLYSMESKEVKQREEMGRKRASPSGFNPRITLNMPPKKDTTQPKQAGVEEKSQKQSKSWSDWFTVSK